MKLAKLAMEETIYETCFCISRTGGISTVGTERRRTEKAEVLEK